MSRHRASAVAIRISLPRALLKRVDGWVATQGTMTRSGAVEQLLGIGLGRFGTTARIQKAKKGTARAAGMAGEMIDYLGDQSASVSDREHRKRRLLRGPSEFRKMRDDHSAKQNPRG